MELSSFSMVILNFSVKYYLLKKYIEYNNIWYAIMLSLLRISAWAYAIFESIIILGSALGSHIGIQRIYNIFFLSDVNNWDNVFIVNVSFFDPPFFSLVIFDITRRLLSAETLLLYSPTLVLFSDMGTFSY